MDRLVFLITTLCFGIQLVNAQQRNFATTGYNTDSGLTANSITDIAQDNTGFLWIATNNGLNRFDGKHFVRFNHVHGDTNSIINNTVSKVVIGGNSDLLIGYGSDGLQRLDRRGRILQTFHNERDAVRSIYTDDDGIIWAGFYSDGLLRIDPKNKTVKKINLIENRNILAVYNTVYDIHEDKEHCLWLATHNGLYRYNKCTDQLLEFPYYTGKMPFPRSDLFLDIAPDENGLWLASWTGGISYFSFNSRSFERFTYYPNERQLPTKNIVTSIVKQGDTLWLATRDRSLLIFDTKSKAFSDVNPLLAEQGFLTLPTVLTSLLLAKDGMLWVGSEDGLFQIDISKPLFPFTRLNVTRTDNLQFYRVKKILEDSITNKIAYAVSFADGLNVIDIRTKTQKNYPVQLGGGEQVQLVNDLLYTGPDSLWVVSRDYVQIFDLTKDRWIDIVQPPQLGKDANIFTLAKPDPQGNIVIATFNNGIFKFNIKDKNYSQIPFSRQPSMFVSDLTFDSNGYLYVGTTDKGVMVSSSTEKRILLRKTESAQSIKSDQISGLHTDRLGNVWVSSRDNGVSRLSFVDSDSLVIENFNNDFLLNLPAYDIIEDAVGDIWAATIKGLVRFTPQSGQTEIFSISDGIKGAYPEYKFSSNGKKLFVSGNGGYYEFYPEKIKATKTHSELVVNTFNVNGLDFDLKQIDSTTYVADLNYDENFLSINFSAINFRNPQALRVLHKLNGVDNSWIPDNQSRNISYSRLEPGNYTLLISMDRPENRSTMTIHIFIRPPFWKKQWFFVLVCALAILIAYLAINAKIVSVKREEQIKTEFNKRLTESQLTALQSQMNPHFIFNSLNSINRYIIKESIHKASDYLTKFAKLIRSILENSVEKSVALEKELKTINLYLELEALRYDNKFEFEIFVDESLNPEIEIPSMIIQPFLENSIWHGILHKDGRGFIKVEVLPAGKELLRVVVIDNGIGRKRAADMKSRTATKNKSYGIELSHERLRILNGSLDTEFIYITDLYDLYGRPEGTRVEILLKYKKGEIRERWLEVNSD
jgi:ligand-binding sensor domain-containing protein/two-component sensor histidine kinase